MSKEKISEEKIELLDFEMDVFHVDREKGHVHIRYNGREYKWFLDRDRRLILVNEREENIESAALQAMKKRVWAILGRELKDETDSEHAQ
jgi:hypothetical protein